MTVVNVASHFKEAKPLTSKDTAEVAGAFQKIYKHGPLKWPELLRWTRDTNSFTNIQCGWGDIHQDQAIMERFYRTLVECLFEDPLLSKEQNPFLSIFFHIFNITWTPSFQKSTAAHKVTEKASPPSKSLLLLQKCPKMMRKNG